MKQGEVKEENIQCSVFFNAVYSFFSLFDALLIIHLPACFDHHSDAQAREEKNKCELQSVNTSRARLCLVVMSSCISVMRGVVCGDSRTLWSTSGSAWLLRHCWTLSSEIRTVSALLQCTVLPKSPLRSMSQTPQFGWQHCVLNMLSKVRINKARASINGAQEAVSLLCSLTRESFFMQLCNQSNSEPVGSKVSSRLGCSNRCPSIQPSDLFTSCNNCVVV